jgi:hypothetical protein
MVYNESAFAITGLLRKLKIAGREEDKDST